MSKALLVIWFFSASGGNTPIVTKMDSMVECQAARLALLEAFPRVDHDWTHSDSGLRAETISCVGYSD